MTGFALHKLALEMDEVAISDWPVSLFAPTAGTLKGEALQNYVNRSLNNLPLHEDSVRRGGNRSAHRTAGLVPSR
jgi:NTE family protein